ncbi:MAG: MATE family efflux transporter [Paracoccaceae bacterium]
MQTATATRPGVGNRYSFAILNGSRQEVGGILRLAAPVAALALVNMAMSVTDTLMAASLGAESLAATAVGSDFYSLVFYLSVGILGGLAPLYAAAHASEDADLLRRLRGSGWFIAVVIGGPAITAVWFSPDYLYRIGIAPALLERGDGYIRAMGLTLAPMIAAMVLRTRLTASERAGSLLWITATAVPMNAALNYVLMFGVAGWPGLGITGAGVSSFVVASFTAAGFAWLAARNGDRGMATRIDWVQVREILRVGLPIGVATVSEVGLFLGATLYVATISVPDAAAHALAIRTAGVVYAISIGLQQAALVRLARAAADIGRHRAIMAGALALAVVAGVVIFSAVLTLAGSLPTVLQAGTSGADAARIAAQLLVLLALSELVTPLGAASAGLLRGLRITRPAMIFSLAGNWLIAAPIAIWLSSVHGMGAQGVWIGLAFGPSVAGILTAASLRRHWTNVDRAPAAASR